MERLEIEDCIQRLREEIRPLERLRMVSLTECCGMVLGQDVTAPMMVPPFPKSAMDGYAVCAEDIARASNGKPVLLKVTGELLAGDYQEIPYEKNTAVRVMTGAYIPGGFDAVVRQEDTDYGEETVKIYVPVSPYQNYCVEGEDIRRGEVVLRKGARLSPVHVGLLASLGQEKVCVYDPARIAVISTGTELTQVGEPLLPGRIYSSISYLLAADIMREGLQVIGPGLCLDEENQLAEELKRALETADMVITTGAVSVGKKDIVPGVLEQLGARILFRGANIQPGTPTLGAVCQDKVILCLSGNPYAAMANFELYFWPAMAKMMHSDSYQTVTETAVLDSEYSKVNRNRRLIRAYAAGGRVMIPTSVHASSVICNLTRCNCFIDLEAGRAVKPGDQVRIRYFKNAAIPDAGHFAGEF